MRHARGGVSWWNDKARVHGSGHLFLDRHPSLIVARTYASSRRCALPHRARQRTASRGTPRDSEGNDHGLGHGLDHCGGQLRAGGPAQPEEGGADLINRLLAPSDNALIMQTGPIMPRHDRTGLHDHGESA
jgi:hypothetical protein